MSDNNSNPESLHNRAKNAGKVKPAFVNPGTPAAPLTSMADKPNPEVSPKGSQGLRDNLMKG
jgi:hypothetical protein